jgi:hypothetical protein
MNTAAASGVGGILAAPRDARRRYGHRVRLLLILFDARSMWEETSNRALHGI